MDSKKHTTPAFPIRYQTGVTDGVPDWTVNEGMSLRDYFAAKVMLGMIVAATKLPVMDDAKAAAFAYAVADAMLKEREK